MEARIADCLRPPLRIHSGKRDHHARLPVILVIGLVGFGSLLGLPGIVLSELSFFVAAPWLSAPVIEEIMKPFGVYLLVMNWPGNVRRQLSIALLSGMAGLVFGLLESVLYVFSYSQNQLSADYVLFRFTVPVLLHVVASTMFGFSINAHNLRSVMRGDVKRKSLWMFPAIAIAIHAIYNITVTVWNPDF
jgi:RsiW-degrading membrane proteinase PrsW (M82 family)